MIRKILKSKQLTALIVLVLIAILGVLLFVFRPREKQIKGAEDNNGTIEEYKEGTIAKKLFGGLGKEDKYTTSILPTLNITDSTDKQWEVKESILKDKDSSFNANIVFKSDNINVVFAISNSIPSYGVNYTCFSDEELVKINDVWTRERMYEVSGQQTGFHFIKNSNYINKEASEFDKYYNSYIELQKQLSITPKDKSVISKCATSSRFNTISYNSGSNKFRDGVVRIFYNKGENFPTDEELKRVDNFFKNTVF